MRYVQVRLADEEYEALDQIFRLKGYRSLQEVARQAIREFVTKPEQEPADEFLELAGRFYSTAPEALRLTLEILGRKER